MVLSHVAVAGLGSTLAVSWTSTMLLMIQLFQLYFYFNVHASRDGLLVRVLVTTVVVVSLLTLMTTYAGAYLAMVTNWGNPAYISTYSIKGHWPAQVYVLLTSVSALLVHCFLIHRVWILLKSKTAVVVLALLSFVGFGGAVADATLLILKKQSVERSQHTVAIWLGGTAGADVVIAVALAVKLWLVKEEVSKFSQNVMEKPLGQIILTSIEVGGVTSLYAIGTLITFLKCPKVGLSLTYGLSHWYGVTLLLLLNRRPSRDPTATLFSPPFSPGGWGRDMEDENTIKNRARRESSKQSIAGSACERDPERKAALAAKDPA
ncbi:hypothetical protein MNV49_001164 [Pseudohyphozyma bogoriensis]|nr:hypothetical protein MNV49_001164 [Pseudohyphozyma bogoriensis]